MFRTIRRLVYLASLALAAHSASGQKLLDLTHLTSLIKPPPASNTGSDTTALKTGNLAGRVVHVDDGDTVVLLVNGSEQMKVRLASIDAPESSHTNKQTGRIGQPFNANSTRYLSQMVKGRDVEAKCPDKDRYGRIVCEIFVDGRSANAAMVSSGMAWANTAANGRYLRDRSLLDAQEKAKQARLGLWADENPIPPWEWRHECWERGNCSKR